ncbi:MAG: hypothetical protein QME94_16965 [Anaerolineae bacterium]|nr:hypothetical protein [Anaerolineae bacterium]
MSLRAYWSGLREWVDRGTEWVERMWLRDDRTPARRGAGEHRWTWIWLGRDATDGDIDDLVAKVDEEVNALPAPLGIADIMITVTAWGARRDGLGEGAYLEAKQVGDEVAMREDLALRDAPRVVPIGDPSRAHVIDRQAWASGRPREELRRNLRLCRPSRQWRIVQVSLFSVGEAYLKLASSRSPN